jgi:Flp pilus assembly protein TadB
MIAVGRLQERDTRRAVFKFARLQFPGFVAGVLLVIPAVVLGYWISWLLVVPILGVGAFLCFWWVERRRHSRGTP